MLRYINKDLDSPKAKSEGKERRLPSLTDEEQDIFDDNLAWAMSTASDSEELGNSGMETTALQTIAEQIEVSRRNRMSDEEDREGVDTTDGMTDME